MEPSNLGINHKYLQLSDLRRLSHFVFAPRRALEGLYTGRHATPQRGHSVEFRDYRQYTPGDDVKSVDWKVFGRTDKLFVKIFESETEMSVTLLVDASASMAYSSPGGLRKFDQAAKIAAAIGFLVVNQQDRFAFGIARGGLHAYHPHASASPQVTALLETLGSSATGEVSQLAEAISQVSQHARRREIVIICSDLWDDQESILKSLAQILHRGGEAILFHTLHPDELDLPKTSHGIFIDSESRDKVRVQIDDVREEYSRRVTQHLASWQSACQRMGIDYCRVMTDEMYHERLQTFLMKRAG